ncbi:trifunctional purine biosynthetic protein adenosine-3-like [Sphaeramia orbicularis]|uniref:trifunctional purine biosynthetic protein adenosine-3-like n=1 Tax=Sphaeramia orbicularis TaxID=375764 RepID=UPI00117D9B17|nr:trifunctional purine biosynthetic protein adenosine-3-like [Sphaeramia orbicularis]
MAERGTEILERLTCRLTAIRSWVRFQPRLGLSVWTLHIVAVFTWVFSRYSKEEVDAGAIIVQEAVPVLRGDTEDTLSDRIKGAEHRAYPEAVELVSSGSVRLGEDGRIIWDSKRS